ncbi:hypothetical protein GCM10020256_25010 [Streptomyces thermocoprophilus]
MMEYPETVATAFRELLADTTASGADRVEGVSGAAESVTQGS